MSRAKSACFVPLGKGGGLGVRLGGRMKRVLGVEPAHAVGPGRGRQRVEGLGASGPRRRGLQA